jgi:two-component sensor histidine kinase
MKINRQLLLSSWRSRFTGDKTRVGPPWLQLAWTGAFCAAIALPFTVVGFVLFGRNVGDWHRLDVWAAWYGSNLVIALCIGYTIDALFAIGRRWIGGPHRLGELSTWRRALLFYGVPVLGVLLGWPVGMMLAGFDIVGWIGGTSWGMNVVAGTLLLAALISVLFSLIFSAKARQLQAEKRATEAQLRLLQGQIEPHFLFNTLANVITLIDHDAPRARQMLEAFTDYLRSSLTSLRRHDATLGTELDLAEAYLGLLKTRMEDRLQFSVASEPALREALLPPLLLQPLVENAIHHGIEPKVEGGHVRVVARLEGSTLVLEVADDGLGLVSPPRRRGAGMALVNLRQRLLAQYGGGASLTLAGAHPGTVATLRLPFEKAATP